MSDLESLAETMDDGTVLWALKRAREMTFL